MKFDPQRLQTLDQVREFLAGSRPLDLQPQTRAEAFAFVAETLQRFDYRCQGKANKGLIRRFLSKVIGLSRAQVTRLLHQHRTTGAIADRRRPRRPFPRRYTKADIGLLAEVDALHGTLSGPATRQLCVRALHLFGDPRFERLAAVSASMVRSALLATSLKLSPSTFSSCAAVASICARSVSSRRWSLEVKSLRFEVMLVQRSLQPPPLAVVRIPDGQVALAVARHLKVGFLQGGDDVGAALHCTAPCSTRCVR